jgi:putative oxidoreductase
MRTRILATTVAANLTDSLFTDTEISRDPGFGMQFAPQAIAKGKRFGSDADLIVIEALLNTNPDWVLTIARLVLGIVFFAHGAQKLLGWYGGSGFNSTLQILTKQLRIPAPMAVLVISAEFFGGTGLIIGLLSRVAALGIALTMLGAIVMVNARHGLFMDWYRNRKGHGFEYHLLAITLAILVIIRGAGAFSVDRALYDHQTAQASTLEQIRR